MGRKKETDLTEDSIMPFGSHKGKKLSEVPTEYLKYLLETTWFMTDPKHEKLRAYIENKFTPAEETEEEIEES